MVKLNLFFELIDILGKELEILKNWYFLSLLVFFFEIKRVYIF